MADSFFVSASGLPSGFFFVRLPNLARTWSEGEAEHPKTRTKVFFISFFRNTDFLQYVQYCCMCNTEVSMYPRIRNTTLVTVLHIHVYVQYWSTDMQYMR